MLTDSWLLATAAAGFMQVLQSSPECTEAILELARLHLDAGRHCQGRDLVPKALGTRLQGPRDAVLLARELLAVGESRILREVRGTGVTRGLGLSHAAEGVRPLTRCKRAP